MFDATAPIVIGENVNLGHGVLITTSHHLTGGPERRGGQLEPKPVRIGDGAWLASRVIVLPGVDVGDGAIVGAGAVVTRSVPPHSVVAGVPAARSTASTAPRHSLGEEQLHQPLSVLVGVEGRGDELLRRGAEATPQVR